MFSSEPMDIEMDMNINPWAMVDERLASSEVVPENSATLMKNASGILTKYGPGFNEIS